MFDSIVTLATVPAVLALVNLGKELGLSSKWAMLLAVALGVALSVTDFAWGNSGWYAAVSSGLLLGLAASGIYDLGRKPETFVTERAAQDGGEA